MIKIKLKTHELDTSNNFFYIYEPSMYMDEIQYTYKPCKLLFMESIHETNICILDILKTQCIHVNKPKHKTVYMINQN